MSSPGSRGTWGDQLPSDWWRVETDDGVIGYGWLDDVWGDAEILLAVEEPARGTGAGAFALARLEDEAAARGLNYVVNVVRDTTRPDGVTGWFLAHGFSGTDDGRLRKQVGARSRDIGQRQSGRPGSGRAEPPDDGRRARYVAERDRAAARPRADRSAPGADMGPGTRRAAATSTRSSTVTERPRDCSWRDVTMGGVEASRVRCDASSGTGRGERAEPAADRPRRVRAADGRPVWTSALIELLADLEVAEKAARQAIMRTADSGWIEASRVGRETRWSLTAAGTELLREGTGRIYSFAAEERPWDGRWLVLTVGVPENNRALRQRLRTQLGWAGLGSPTPGVWVTPRVDREPQARGCWRSWTSSPAAGRSWRPPGRWATSGPSPARRGTWTRSSSATRTSWSWSAAGGRGPIGRR